MPLYRSPVEDHQFLLHHHLRLSDRTELPGFADLTPGFTGELLSSAARFHEEVLHPINAPGDQEGARLVDGRVVTPQGFREAWAMHSDSGWHRLTLPEAIGGAGLPPVLSVAVDEIGVATGHAFKMYGGFCAPTAHMLQVLGDDWMKTHVVPRLVAGDWTATMCLTESHCGTDLRQIRTRAVPADDGSWRLSGSKIFISGGDHDLTENIVHIVLAKVPGDDGRVADDLSAVHVFLVSKRELDVATGQLGEPNRVGVSAIEHKMGIEASATCVLDFDQARAWRIAGQGAGSSGHMAAMFLLMNHARLGTAISGIAYADMAYQNAAAYARERLSGRSAAGVQAPDQAADPIVVHADVRRLLLESRAFAEGARALALRVALYQSEAADAPDPAQRRTASDMVELMTPVMKAYFTDCGFNATNACQQVLGGHGYVRDWGLEQMVRNARIGQIYEGANGVQAIDLVTRKLTAHGGRRMGVFRDVLLASVERCTPLPAIADLAQRLRQGLDRLAQAHQAVQRQAADDPHAPTAAAHDLLTMYGILAVGWAWLETAETALRLPEDLAATVGRSKRQLAQVWMDRQMPCLAGLAERIQRGSVALMAMDGAQV
ncbi:MAG: acyl-CoA dehydrogenase C-terminal domain-containing protein [Hydrogenophaga sp.]|nr:acyl-CoA dehydrogenase C-terminal domain-containing protein [Hydrogenophaga sp.]